MGTLRVTLGLAALLGALSGCFEGSTGGSETTNGLTGLIRDADGNPAAGSEVTLVPETYNPIPGKDARILRQARADLQGRYRFARIEPGTYNLEARDSARDLKLLVRRVEVKAAGGAAAKVDGALAKTGALLMPFADRSLPAGAIAYIPGTTWYAPAEVGAAGKVNLVRLPPGLVPELKVGFPDSTADSGYALAESVEILAAEVVALGPVQAWKHSRTLLLDLSAVPGADSLLGLPVLLRLKPGDIDLAGAAPDGRDLRFFRSGIRLPHQVEVWDPAAGTAAVWIRLDSVPGNPGDTTLTMHWGREDALDVSSGTGVFAAGAGFSTVWHLGETENVSAGGYRDAAASGAHATAAAPNAASRVAAQAGFGKRFGEGGGGLTASMPAGLGGDASFSISFWTKFDAAPKRQNILYFGEDTLLLGFHFFIRTDTTAQIGPWDITPGSVPSARQNHFSLAPWLGRWVHLATVYDAQAQKLTTYVNGTVAAVNDLTGLQIETAPGVFVGSPFRLESAFNGALDEVRFYDRPVSPAWIRAEYETSKEGSNSLKPK